MTPQSKRTKKAKIEFFDSHFVGVGKMCGVFTDRRGKTQRT
jgi:hypothetical protein